jgi:hypothetical protein
MDTRRENIIIGAKKSLKKGKIKPESVLIQYS